jgi:hypothetical protein
LQENSTLVTQSYYENATEFQVVDLGDRVVTPGKLDSIAFERRVVPEILALPKKHKKVLTAILKFDADYLELHFSQVGLANKLKIGLSTVKRALCRFKEIGILQWVFRGIKKTCLYTFSPFMSSKSLRDKLAAIVAGFKYIPMAVLVAQNLSTFAAPVLRVSEPQCTNVENTISKSLFSLMFIFKSGGGGRESLCVGKDVCARARIRITPPHLFLSKNQENDMSYSQSLAIAAASSIKSMNLTPFGKLIISSYPADAIRYADEKMCKRTSPSANPMAAFSALCKEHCEKTGDKPSFSRLMQFKKDNPEWAQLPEVEVVPVAAPIKRANVFVADRDPLTFDRVGEWTKFVLEGKRRVAAGEKVNPFWQAEIDQYDLAQEQGAAITESYPIQAMGNVMGLVIPEVPVVPIAPRVPVVVPGYEPLDEEDLDLIDSVINNINRLDKSTVGWLAKAIAEVKEQGANHPRIQDGSFRSGLKHVRDIVAPRVDDVPYDMSGDYEVVDYPYAP